VLNKHGDTRVFLSYAIDAACHPC